MYIKSNKYQIKNIKKRSFKICSCV